MMDKHVSIVGGGIAGLTLACHLQKSGTPYTVFEQAPNFKTVGAGIILANNAMQVFQKLGLAEELSEKGRRVSYLNLVDEQLNILTSSDLSPFESKYGVKNIAIHRADLQASLLNRLDADQVHLNKRVESISDNELSFSDGTKHKVDVLIGADGIHSQVRAALFGEVPIQEAGQVCWRGVVDYQLPDSLAYQFNEAWGPGVRFGFGQINERQVYWFALSKYKASVSEWDGEDWKQGFNSFHPVVVDLLRLTPDDTIHRGEISQLAWQNTWYKGDVCLIGDACHAMTPNMGQGAGQGIEDAYILAHCLKDNDVSEAFKRFQKLRIRKVKTIVNTSWRIGKIAQLDSSISRKLRNMILRITPQKVAQNQLAKLIQLEI